MKGRSVNTAIAAFKTAVQADPGSAEAAFQLGNAYFERGFARGTPDTADKADAQRAVESYQTALAIDPKLGEVSEPFLLRHGMAQCYETLGRLDEAVEQTRLAAKAAPRNPMPPLYLAEIELRRGDSRHSAESLLDAIERARKIHTYAALSRLVRRHPQFAALAQAPRTEIILHDYDDVETGALTVASARERAEERIAMRDSLNDQPRGAAAQAQARLLAAPPVDNRVLGLIESADGDFKWRKYRSALAGYRAAFETDRRRGTLTGAERARILENVGVAYRQLGQADEAVTMLQRSIQEVPQSSSAYYQLALAQSAAGRFLEAMNALDLSLRNAPNIAGLRKTLILARTEPELDAMRDMPGFNQILDQHSHRARIAPRP